ncbi:MAG: hypothetical protein DMF53_14760 [Acidobacteria bacterium]|nr:MAG: hypothetical protein DMF53_14760 [Acidobacteriota bacterium]
MPFDPRNFEIVDDEMAAVFRTMSGAQRLKIANDMSHLSCFTSGALKAGDSISPMTGPVLLSCERKKLS